LRHTRTSPLVWIEGIYLVREDAADRDLLGGERDEAIAFVEHHRLGGHHIFRHPQAVSGRHQVSKDAVQLLDGALHGVFERCPLRHAVGQVDRDELRVALETKR